MARGLRICLCVSALFLIIVSIVIVTLSLTIFKPKNPLISVHLAGFDHSQFFLLPNLTTNVSLGMVITIANPNHGSFKYRDSIGHINYRDTIVGEVPMGAELVPARSEINVSTSADFMVGKLIHDPNFWSDIIPGSSFNLTSTAELPGKAIILKFIKLKATGYSLCDISVNISSNDVRSSCISRIKLF